MLKLLPSDFLLPTSDFRLQTSISQIRCTVDVNDASGDVGRSAAGQIGHQAGNFGGRGSTVQRALCPDLFAPPVKCNAPTKANPTGYACL
ncbi:MAG: hypothetical protein U1C46_09370 [Bacteroidales bacterium]|nr:hypothetical protein [Bacteroidales bacterium]